METHTLEALRMALCMAKASTSGRTVSSMREMSARIPSLEMANSDGRMEATTQVPSLKGSAMGMASITAQPISLPIKAFGTKVLRKERECLTLRMELSMKGNSSLVCGTGAVK
jgi:hypothetical protein